MSGPYRKVFNEGLSHARQVADPFHLCKLANEKLDECRRRVQNETLGHRGRKDGPLYRARRLLTKAHERLDERGETKLAGLLEAGDPKGEVRMAWHAKETVRGSTTSRIRSWPTFRPRIRAPRPYRLRTRPRQGSPRVRRSIAQRCE